MCNCASCSYTDEFADKGFAAWPRGKPAGAQSTRGYAAHVAYGKRGLAAGYTFKPGAAPHYPITGTPHARHYLLIPGESVDYHRDKASCSIAAHHAVKGCVGAAEVPATIKEYVEIFDRVNGLIPQKQRPAFAGRARPETPCKAPQHFPAPDRRRQTATIYAMPKNQPKRPRGRPAMPGRRVVVKLEERHVKRARELGGDNIAEGIRKALTRQSSG